MQLCLNMSDIEHEKHGKYGAYAAGRAASLTATMMKTMMPTMGTPNQLSWLGAGLSITKSGVRFPLKGRICGRGDPKLGKGLRIPRIPRHPGIAKVSPLAVQSSSPGCQPIRRWTCGIRSRPEGSPTEEQRIGFRRNSYSPRGNGI